MCSIVAQVPIFAVWPASSKVGSLSLLWKSLMAATMTKIQLHTARSWVSIDRDSYEWIDKPLGPVRHWLVIFMPGQLTDFHERERQWRTEGFWRPGRRWGLAPLPLGVSDWQASKALSLAIGGSGTEPQLPTLLGKFGCKWNPFLNSSVNTIFQLGVSDRQGGQAPKALSLAVGGLGRGPSRQRFWEHLCVNGTHFLIALTPFPTWRVKLASAEGALSRYWWVWGGAFAFGSIWVWMEPIFE